MPNHTFSKALVVTATLLLGASGARAQEAAKRPHAALVSDEQVIKDLTATNEEKDLRAVREQRRGNPAAAEA